MVGVWTRGVEWWKRWKTGSKSGTVNTALATFNANPPASSRRELAFTDRVTTFESSKQTDLQLMIHFSLSFIFRAVTSSIAQKPGPVSLG